jgi:transposase
MRVATLFKRLLRLGRERVVGVELEEDEVGIERVIVAVALRARRVSRCSGCAARVHSVYDSRRRSWRHLDMGRVRCVITCEVRRVCCPGCGVRVEAVPWARAGSRFTRAFEDTAVYLVKHAPKSTVASLMRIDWHTVGRMIERVVAEHVASRPGDGLDGLRRVGIDEVAYRKGHRYLMCVSDHDTGALVWAAPGRSQQTADAFYRALGPARCDRLRAVSLDLHGGWIGATRAHAPGALICADPFHVLKLAGDALDRVRRDAWQALREEDPERAAFIKGTRFAVRRRAGNLRPGDRTVLDELAADNHDIYRGWLLVEQLRAVYQAPTAEDAHALLDEWILAALTSELDPFTRCALTIDAHRDLVVNAITERLSNARLEGMNSTVRLLSHRARGYRRLASLLAMITLVCGRVPVALPT